MLLAALPKLWQWKSRTAKTSALGEGFRSNKETQAKSSAYKRQNSISYVTVLMGTVQWVESHIPWGYSVTQIPSGVVSGPTGPPHCPHSQGQVAKNSVVGWGRVFSPLWGAHTFCSHFMAVTVSQPYLMARRSRKQVLATQWRAQHNLTLLIARECLDQIAPESHRLNP